MDRPQGRSEHAGMLRRILIALGALVLIVVGAFVGVIAFDSPATPPALAAGDSIPGMAQWNFAELPKVQSLKARDRAPLNYRLYPGSSRQAARRTVVLVQGS